MKYLQLVCFFFRVNTVGYLLKTKTTHFQGVIVITAEMPRNYQNVIGPSLFLVTSALK